MTTPAPYRLVILGADQEWIDEVRAACAQAITQLIGPRQMLSIEDRLPAVEDPAESPPQTLVVFLADADSDDPDLLEQVDQARERILAVLPIVRPGSDVHSTLPEVLRPLNAVPWEPSTAVLDILRLLGLIESRRRLFLSYRRHETSGLALQLREHLSRRVFDVFLDRFSVPPAADFQRRIDIELSDKAFVLLLESRSAIGSPWVQHEVAYALTHGISLMTLTLPGVSARERFPTVDNAFRYRLTRSQLQPSGNRRSRDTVLTAVALEKVLNKIENEYARRLRKRREQLLGSLKQWLDSAGQSTQPVANEWALSVPGPAETARVYLITPRATAPADLRELDRLRTEMSTATGEPVDGYLVYAAPVQDPDDENLIRWIVNQRPLYTCAHHTVPDLLGLR